MKTRINKKAIGLLGGMGPQASVYLQSTLIELSVKYFGAKTNEGFPEIILNSIPVPDFISNNFQREIALKMLKDRTIMLSKRNVLCLAIACNTAHVLIDKLRAVSKVPFVSMIDEVVNEIYQDKLHKVGLLSTPSTVKYALYQNALTRKGIIPVIPRKREQIILEKIIRNILGGKITIEDRRKLMLISNMLKQKGAEGIILGCTELPLAFPKRYLLPVYNSVKILAEVLLQKYYKQNTI